ncbi:MAG: glycosyltransferase family 29 protein [Alphaproteobacteria bacterium]|nr:glycosyltransferase family 29 protein [Alphaproteobacteria bacterium]
MKIAVVGNGAGLIGRNCGATIDAHDFVVRMNHFRLESAHEDLGARINIYMATAAALNSMESGTVPSNIEFWNPHLLGQSELPDDDVRERDYLRCLTQYQDKLFSDNRIGYERLTRLSQGNGKSISWRTYRNILRSGNYLLNGTPFSPGGILEEPTTGVKAIAMAIEMAPGNVEVFGFDFFQTSTHFWAPTEADPFPHHNYRADENAVRSWSAQGLLKIVDYKL